MSVSFAAYEWLQLIGLGGAAGALGQGMRTIVGLKKVNDATSGSPRTVSEALELDRLVISLAIGFIAGALAGATTIGSLSAISTQQILALAAAGYAGADFIEGFMSRVAPAPSLPAGQEGIGTGANTGAVTAHGVDVVDEAVG